VSSNEAKIPFRDRFGGQTAIVTGGAAGLGKGIAARIGAEGGRVAILDRDADHLDATVSELAGEGSIVRGFVGDIADEASVSGSIAAVVSELGAPDVLVHCAAIVGPTSTPILNYRAEDFDRVYSVNLKGSFLVLKHTLEAMVPRGKGRVLLVSSIAGKEGNPGMCGYSATKAGVIGLVKGVAKEYAESGITINGLAPAVVMTDMVRGIAPDQVAYMTSKIPMKRLGTIDEVAALAAWIVSSECSFTTGFVFDLSGGRATY